MWLDSRDFGIERWAVVNEVNGGRRGLVAQHESGVRSVRRRPVLPAIQSHREQESGKEGHGDDCAPDRWAGAVQHESEYNVRPSPQRQSAYGECMHLRDECPSVSFADGLSSAARVALH
jgi:hypothetical protein